MCVCVCVCVRERERESVCVCVCVGGCTLSQLGNMIFPVWEINAMPDKLIISKSMQLIDTPSPSIPTWTAQIFHWLIKRFTTLTAWNKKIKTKPIAPECPRCCTTVYNVENMHADQTRGCNLRVNSDNQWTKLHNCNSCVTTEVKRNKHTSILHSHPHLYQWFWSIPQSYSLVNASPNVTPLRGRWIAPIGAGWAPTNTSPFFLEMPSLMPSAKFSDAKSDNTCGNAEWVTASSSRLLGPSASPSLPCSGKRGPQSEAMGTLGAGFYLHHCPQASRPVPKLYHVSSSLLAFVRAVQCIFQHSWNQWLQVFQHCRHRLGGWKQSVVPVFTAFTELVYAPLAIPAGFVQDFHFQVPELKNHFPRPSYCSVKHTIWALKLQVKWVLYFPFITYQMASMTFLNSPSAVYMLTIIMKFPNFPWPKSAIFPKLAKTKKCHFPQIFQAYMEKGTSVFPNIPPFVFFWQTVWTLTRNVWLLHTFGSGMILIFFF